MERLIRAALNSRDGLAVAWREAAFRQETAALALGVPLALLIAPNAWIALAMIGAILFVMAVEVLNTAIECLSDHVTPEIHPAIKQAKDLGSAAVAISIVIAVAIWGMAIAERLLVAS